jgi:arginine decarboxylase-like protein
MMTDDDQQKLAVMMVELSGKIQILLDKQDELADNINKIKEAVYNPDLGLYARLKDLDARIQNIENWKATNARILWIVGGTVSALLVQTAWSLLF